MIYEVIYEVIYDVWCHIWYHIWWYTPLTLYVLQQLLPMHSLLMQLTTIMKLTDYGLRAGWAEVMPVWPVITNFVLFHESMCVDINVGHKLKPHNNQKHVSQLAASYILVWIYPQKILLNWPARQCAVMCGGPSASPAHNALLIFHKEPILLCLQYIQIQCMCVIIREQPHSFRFLAL